MGADPDIEHAGFPAHGVVGTPEREHVGRYREAHALGFAGFEIDVTEVLELAYRPNSAGGNIADIELRQRCSRTCAGIAHIGTRENDLSVVHDLAIERD